VDSSLNALVVVADDEDVFIVSFGGDDVDVDVDCVAVDKDGSGDVVIVVADVTAVAETEDDDEWRRDTDASRGVSPSKHFLTGARHELKSLSGMSVTLQICLRDTGDPHCWAT
jgi:hypothetical protein